MKKYSLTIQELIDIKDKIPDKRAYSNATDGIIKLEQHLKEKEANDEFVSKGS